MLAGSNVPLWHLRRYKKQLNSMKKITRNTNLGQIIQSHPKLAQVLVEDYGLHCAGCYAAAFDSLEQGAAIHGMSEKQIEKMIKHLNELINIE